MLFNGHRAARKLTPVTIWLVRHPFHLHGAFFLAQNDAARAGELEQDWNNLLQSHCDGERRRLQRKVFAVAIDNQPAEAIGFAVNEPRRATGIPIAEIAEELNRSLQTATKECLVEQIGRIPGV